VSIRADEPRTSTRLFAQQSVVQVHRRTENGHAPRWQGATTEKTGPRAASRRGGREGIAGRTADEQECTGAQARWRIMWLTNDGPQRALFEALRKLESGKTGNVGLKWFEILTIPGVAQSLMSLLLRGEFR
jgi:hypothetical protein